MDAPAERDREGEDGGDRISVSDATDSIKKLTIEAEEIPNSSRNSNEQSHSTKIEEVVHSTVQQDAAPTNQPTSITGQTANPDGSNELNIIRPPNIYTPQPHAVYFGGYNNVPGDWEEYFPYVNPEGIEIGSPNIYNEGQSLLFHAGYGYNPQPYGPYSPMTPPLTSSSGDGQIYPPQQYQMASPYYQQQLPPNLSFLNSPTQVPQTNMSVPVGMDQQQQGAFLSDNSNSNNMLFGPKPNHPSHSAFGRSNYTGNSGNQVFYSSHQGFDGFNSGGTWLDWSRSSDDQKPLAPQYSPLASPHPMNAHASYVHNPFASGVVTQQQNPLYHFGSSFSSFDRGYSRGGLYNHDDKFNANMGTNGRGWNIHEKGRRRGKGEASMYSHNDTLDFLSEQSRGPRATRSKNSISDHNQSVESETKNLTTVNLEIYNKPEFIIEYTEAMFFIIKSYTEDNVHKSIKYGIWASTPNGNRKLDAAYHEANERGGACPIFLFFSVNSSSQFCGVAEMIGTVNFDESVDFWQQDKWSGQFPVKWHIVKDVPNNQFRHIILENNDNKPVTNSRDTQEVKLKQGLEMLSIFKEYESETSILDDFQFYEERQKAMQERKALLQQQQSQSTISYPTSIVPEQRLPISLPVNLVDQVSKNFVHIVRKEENKENVTAREKSHTTVAETNTGDTTNTSIPDGS